MIRPAAFPRRERAQKWMGSGVRELLSSLPLVSACGECERGKARALRVSCSGETGRGDAVRDGPAWLQRHGCEFVTGVMLEAAATTRIQRGGERSICISMTKGFLSGRGQARAIICKYATRDEARTKG
jgi:hypothetical protein